jgi:hypothetical protein
VRELRSENIRTGGVQVDPMDARVESVSAGLAGERDRVRLQVDGEGGRAPIWGATGAVDQHDDVIWKGHRPRSLEHTVFQLTR